MDEDMVQIERVARIKIVVVRRRTFLTFPILAAVVMMISKECDKSHGECE